jgi:hypothetical protein
MPRASHLWQNGERWSHFTFAFRQGSHELRVPFRRNADIIGKLGHQCLRHGGLRAGSLADYLKWRGKTGCYVYVGG